jgi:Viral BACON domain/Putative binding domain, N-terminal
MRIILLLALAVSIAGCGSDQSPSAPCTFTVSASPQSFGVGGGTGSATVSTPSHCSWTARADAGWLSITTANSGSGQGVVNFTVAPSSDASARSGHLIIADQTVSIAQDGLVACQYSVAPVQVSYCVDAVQGASVAVYTTNGCPWTASTDASWITLLNSSVGGSDTLRFNVASNYLAPGRESVIKIRWPTATEGQNVQVSQSGCMYGVGPSSLNFGSAGGTGQFDVLQQTTPDYVCGGPLQNACVWTAQTSESWISITTSMPQQGDNPVRFIVGANDSPTPRTGRITVADKVVTITQAGR